MSDSIQILLDWLPTFAWIRTPSLPDLEAYSCGHGAPCTYCSTADDDLGTVYLPGRFWRANGRLRPAVERRFISFGASMNLRQLKYFTVVAELKSFRKAAERLHVAQPALSRQIQDLEHEIGAPLFTRLARGVALTELGLDVFDDGSKLLKHFQEFEARVISRRSGLHQKLTVAFHDAVAQNRALTESIMRFKSAFPLAHLILLSLGEQDQLDALRDETIDLFWAYDICGEFQREASLKTYVIQKDAMVLIAALDHPLAEIRSADPSEFKDDPFIVNDSKRAPRFGYKYFVDRCRDAGFQIDTAQEAVNIDMLIGLVASGAGISMVAENIRDDLSSRVAVIKVPTLSLSLDLTIVWAAKSKSDLVSRYLDIVRAMPRSLFTS